MPAWQRDPQGPTWGDFPQLSQADTTVTLQTFFERTSSTYDAFYSQLPDGTYVQVRITATPIPSTISKTHDDVGTLYLASSGMTVDFLIEIFALNSPDHGTLIFNAHLDATTAVKNNNGNIDSGAISVNPANPGDPTHYTIDWTFNCQGRTMKVTGVCRILPLLLAGPTLMQSAEVSLDSITDTEVRAYCPTLGISANPLYILLAP